MAGAFSSRRTRYLVERAANVVTDIHCVDPTWLLGRTRVLAVYATQSATSIILDLVARFTRALTYGRTSQAALPMIDAITFTNETVPACLTAICQQIGAYWYRRLSAIAARVHGRPTSPPRRSRRPIPGRRGITRLSEDLSQVATRIIGLGGGVSASVDLAAGSTELPVDLGNAPTGRLVSEHGRDRADGRAAADLYDRPRRLRARRHARRRQCADERRR